MQYFVITQDGQRFGPVDIIVLNQWAQEGRILPHTVLQEAATMRQITASQTPGLAIPNQNVYQSPYQQSPRDYPRIVDTQGDKYASWAMAMGVCSLLLCPCLAFLGIPLAVMAIQQGSTKGRRALNMNIIALVLMIILAIGYQVAMNSLGSF